MIRSMIQHGADLQPGLIGFLFAKCNEVKRFTYFFPPSFVIMFCTVFHDSAFCLQCFKEKEI